MQQFTGEVHLYNAAETVIDLHCADQIAILSAAHIINCNSCSPYIVQSEWSHCFNGAQWGIFQQLARPEQTKTKIGNALGL